VIYYATHFPLKKSEFKKPQKEITQKKKENIKAGGGSLSVPFLAFLH